MGLDKDRDGDGKEEEEEEVYDVEPPSSEGLVHLKHGSTSCTCVSSFNAHGSARTGTVSSPILQMRTLRLNKSAAQPGLEYGQSSTSNHMFDCSVSDRGIETEGQGSGDKVANK